MTQPQTPSDHANALVDRIGELLGLTPVQPSYATHGLPDPNITGPCQAQSSILCTQVGAQRMDPLDMLESETAFRGYLQMCQACYDANADEFVRVSHGR